MTHILLSGIFSSRRVFASFCGLLMLAACSPTPDQSGAANVAAGSPATASAASIEINKSPNDDRNYRYLVLDNKLRVLLVEDPDTDKAAASLTVLRGSYHEPVPYQGLAHFLEHMLFIGTQKYPEVDGYQQFIATHGGSSNAYTAAEHTNYFFDIDPAQFQAGMDRFSQFFISPLLDPAYVDREKNAVNSEYQMQIKDDGWRVFSATKETMNPDYPGSRFNIGNLETLGDGVGPALNEFFETNYSADQMILVALSNEPLDEMETWVRPMFSAIENRDLGPRVNTVKAFADDRVPAVLNVQTLKNENQISFNFPIPATETYYRSKPAQYLTNLLGHEGGGSLHQTLKNKGWIASLGAGTSRLDETNAYLSVDIELTDAGLAHIDDIGDLLFTYLDMLKKQDPEQWRYDEQATAAALSFQFQEQSSATGFVYRTAPALAIYPPEDVLAAAYLMEEFDPELIKSYLAYLTPDNLITTITGPEVDTDQVERWFEVPYKLVPEGMTVEVVADAGLHLPDPNPFLPEDLALLSNDANGPQLKIDQPGLQLWLDLDTEFTVPRANQSLTLGVPDGFSAPQELVKARLYERLLSDSLNEYAYPALLAGLGYQLSVTPAGFRLGLSGYADKQLELLDTVLERFTTLSIDSDRFAVAKQELVRDWRNFINERPYQQSYTSLSNLLVSTSWPADLLADTLEAVTIKDLEAWRAQRLQNFSVVGLSHGNVSDKDLDAVAELLRSRLSLKPFTLSEPDITVVDDAYLLGLEIDHDDASIVLYRQDPEASHASRAKSALAATMLKQQFFTELRTEQQLGYVVSATNRTLRDRGGVAFIIQSPVASAAQLEAATLSFMQAQPENLEAMTDAEFEQHKAGLVSRLTERDRNLRERTSRYLSDLDIGDTSFDSQAQIAGIVSELRRADMLEFYAQLIADLGKRRVLIYSQGKFDEVPEDGKRLSSATALKQPAQDATSSL
jgi:secreted Zn-dependent insulinase-like peptidase